MLPVSDGAGVAIVGLAEAKPQAIMGLARPIPKYGIGRIWRKRTGGRLYRWN